MKINEVILVNERDEALGVMEKMEAHRKGALHRAFSVFIFDSRGRMLLQQRASEKYHGGLLWTNACCSHPYPGEEVERAAERRLNEELGFTAPIHKIFSFTYRALVENDLTEHEFDHVFAGQYEGEITANPSPIIRLSVACSLKKIIATMADNSTIEILLTGMAAELCSTLLCRRRISRYTEKKLGIPKAMPATRFFH